MSNKIILGVVVLAVALIVWSRMSSTVAVSDDPSVISTNGIHWHPTLSIKVRGETVPIPSNIGLVGGHSPMHTHESDGTIHLEFEGVVRQSDLTLGAFFDLWGKEFNESQVLEYTNSETEQVTMYVNDEKNTEYEAYILGEHDTIEIVFE